MPRPDKVAAVAEVKERIERSQAVFLAEYAGLSVKAQQELRRGLRSAGADFKVIKMTLARRAADELDLDALDELLVGPTGIAFADGDPVTAAKVLKDFATTHEVFAVKGGLLGRSVLSPDRVRALADIAPRELLLARLAGTLKGPLTAMAGLLAALPRGAVTAMQQLLDKRQAGEPAAATPSVASVADVPDGAVAVVEDTPDPGDVVAVDDTPDTADVSDEAVAVVEDTPDPGEVVAVDDTPDTADPPATAEVDETAAEDDTVSATVTVAQDPDEATDAAATAEEE